MSNKLLLDIAERTLATAAEAGLAYVGTRLVDLPPSYVVIVTPLLAAIKGRLAAFVGNRRSASATTTI